MGLYIGPNLCRKSKSRLGACGTPRHSLGQPSQPGVGAVAVGLGQPGVQIWLYGDGGGEAGRDVLAVVHGDGQGVGRVHHHARPRAVQDVGVQRVHGVRAQGRLIVVQEHHQAVGQRDR